MANTPKPGNWTFNVTVDSAELDRSLQAITDGLAVGGSAEDSILPYQQLAKVRERGWAVPDCDADLAWIGRVETPEALKELRTENLFNDAAREARNEARRLGTRLAKKLSKAQTKVLARVCAGHQVDIDGEPIAVLIALGLAERTYNGKTATRTPTKAGLVALPLAAARLNLSPVPPTRAKLERRFCEICDRETSPKPGALHECPGVSERRKPRAPVVQERSPLAYSNPWTGALRERGPEIEVPGWVQETYEKRLMMLRDKEFDRLAYENELDAARVRVPLDPTAGAEDEDLDDRPSGG